MTFRRIAERLSGLEQRATTLDRMVTVASNNAEVPGVQHVKTVPRAPRILEANKLHKLGTAAGRTWFARDDGTELRVDVELPVVALNDSFPPHRVLVHQVEHVAERMSAEGDPNKPWQKGSRKIVRGHAIDRYWKCTIVPAGTFAAAQQRDEARPARRRSSALREPRHPAKVGPANATAVEFWDDLRSGRTPTWRLDER